MEKQHEWAKGKLDELPAKLRNLGFSSKFCRCKRLSEGEKGERLFKMIPKTLGHDIVRIINLVANGQRIAPPWK